MLIYICYILIVIEKQLVASEKSTKNLFTSSLTIEGLLIYFIIESLSIYMVNFTTIIDIFPDPKK